MHSGLIKSGLPGNSPGRIPNLSPGPSPSQDPSPKTPQPGPSSFVVRSGVDPRPSPQDPSPKTHADPINLIAEGRHTIDAICRASGISILELATQVCIPGNLEALGRVAQLYAVQREMLLGKLKRDALVRLGS